MRTNLYYREIADKMSDRLLQNPDQLNEMDEFIHREYGRDNTAYTICAKSAVAFDAVKELSEDEILDWDNALDDYANDVIDHILSGEKIDTLDMISMAAISGQNIR